MDAPAVLSPEELHASRTATLGWARSGEAGGATAERGAAAEALASVRAEGLEPSTYVQELLSFFDAGEISADEMIERVRLHHSR
ncbi:antitoxin VbhA family protein [Pseudonocardia acaciae]|uniref:antitoxin VbhA family protein n=1 Tax=Pseudonocardia acaciae TaxID=551276 RepID=UPI000AA66EE3|nr:antitoxin VbhA family protein [Pseudonocardia acaciae]